jgi:3-hydroxyanthranilate 3,4-dioxygenase
MAHFPVIALQQWIDEHRDLLKPPVGNKVLFKGGEFIVMAVGGPNQRTDFHINPTPELFYQLEGHLTLRTRTATGELEDILVGPGDIFLLPGGVPHSPQRSAGSVGLVVEQLRPNQQLDALAWFCPNCGHELYREAFVLTNVETQFPPIFQRFYDSETHRTCSRCGTVHPRP